MAKKSGSSGGADVKAFLNKLSGQVSSEMKASSDEAARKAAEAVYNKSQEYVPYDTGQLSASGKIVKINTGEYSVQYDDWKAFYLHENIPQDQPHGAPHGGAKYGAQGNAKEYTTSGTGPKYLERSADEVANDKELVRYVRDSLGRFKKRLPKE